MANGFILSFSEYNLGMILRFATVLEGIPPLGFFPQPTLAFGHPEDLEPHMRGLPYVNTCAMALRVPVLAQYDDFKFSMRKTMSEITFFTTE